MYQIIVVILKSKQAIARKNDLRAQWPFSTYTSMYMACSWAYSYLNEPVGLYIKVYIDKFVIILKYCLKINERYNLKLPKS